MTKSVLGKQAALAPRVVQRYLREFEALGVIRRVGEKSGTARTYFFDIKVVEGGDPQVSPLAVEGGDPQVSPLGDTFEQGGGGRPGGA